MADFDKVIPPGQTGKITATLSTQKYRGILNKSIVVVSNDPKTPKLTLYFKCSILGVKVLPMSNVYFNTRVGVEQTKELTIATIGENRLTVYARSSSPNIKTRLEKTGGDQKPTSANEYWEQYKLFITIPDTYPEGRFSGSVTLITDSDFDPSIKLPVSGAVQPSLVVSPGTVRMLSDANGNLPPRFVKITRRFESGLELTKISAEPAQLKVSQEETRKGEQFTLKLIWTEPEKKGIYQGRVVVHTNDTRKPVIDIPVHINLK
ncbi:hypothetical protein JXJ21_01675 [candidate division KSB1 bacterium]|nr:hypothetical protein [candidate division KSB1 bacterium]